MEVIKRNTAYGLRALIALALHDDESAMTAEELADAADATVDFMHKIMQSLRDRGIVESKRGPSGGFRLARDPGEINLLEVVTALQGPINVNRCVIGLEACDRAVSCPLRPTWLGMQKVLEQGLKSTTLAEIVGATGRAPADGFDV